VPAISDLRFRIRNVLCILMPVTAAATPCFDYEDYIERVGELAIPARSMDWLSRPARLRDRRIRGSGALRRRGHHGSDGSVARRERAAARGCARRGRGREPRVRRRDELRSPGRGRVESGRTAGGWCGAHAGVGVRHRGRRRSRVRGGLVGRPDRDRRLGSSLARADRDTWLPGEARGVASTPRTHTCRAGRRASRSSSCQVAPASARSTRRTRLGGRDLGHHAFVADWQSGLQVVTCRIRRRPSSSAPWIPAAPRRRS